ncbi:hypothetical protein [Rhodococcus sp. NPDC058521]|uniref:hypothetical protein n=1 Tax=Rhodococcus sp. NPDC058521 TaxID=3346536 RepID=UPI00366255F5
MIRHVAATALISVTAAVPLLFLPPTAGAAQSDTYISNPADDSSMQDFCDDQATVANNLSKQNHRAQAEEVVSAANMRGCRIFTFESP